MAVNMSFFMGLFFMISGYFVPDSLELKGPFKFVNDIHLYHRILAVSADRGNDGPANQIRYYWGYRCFAGACPRSFRDKAPVVCKIFFWDNSINYCSSFLIINSGKDRDWRGMKSLSLNSYIFLRFNFFPMNFSRKSVSQ